METRAVKRTSDQRVIATRVAIAATMHQRFLGLMGKAGLAAGEGLWLEPCNSIHTFFMRFPIDVVYVGHGGEVISVCQRVQPWRMHFPRLSARAVLELPAGGADGVNKGDTLCLS